MRILLISAAYPPDPGGVATHVVNLARGLLMTSPETHIDVVTLRRRGQLFKKDPKGSLIEWKLAQRMVPEFSGRRVVFEGIVRFIYEHWHEIRPDLVHAHDFDSLQIGIFLKTAYGIPLVFTAHRAPTEWRDRRYRENVKDCLMETVLRHQRRQPLQLVDRIVVPSQASSEVLQSQGFRNVEVIPHGLSGHLLTCHVEPKVLEKLSIPAEADVVFCPCRADEHKDLEVFIRGVAKLRSAAARKVVSIVTSGPEAGEEEPQDARALRNYAEALGLEDGRDIHFVSPFGYGSPLATVYDRSSVVVVPSLRESFGQNVLDSFMFRKPVVARNSMALKEIVSHENNGLLFDTADDLPWQLRRLLEDSELRERVVRTAKEQVTQYYTVERMGRDYEDLYKAVLNPELGTTSSSCSGAGLAADE